jgi:hypothetical protein
LVFCDERTNLLPLAFHISSSSSTTARQISDVPFAVFEVFHPMLHTADTHAGDSIDMTTLMKDNCSRIFLLYEEFNHSMLAKQYLYIIYSHPAPVDFG